ncbi:MAG TPA: hypothetical protein VFF24_01950, partial [Acidimicrobiia bacterium]|nr:hypothetical protein [Acidimicrobiia bacterium]
MGPHQLRRLRLVVVIVLAAAGTGLPARAKSAPDRSDSRVVTLPVPSTTAPGEAEVRLPFAATHLGVRWRGHEEPPVEIRWPGQRGGSRWAVLPVWDDAGDHDAGLVASGLVRSAPGSTRVALRWPADVTDL